MFITKAELITDTTSKIAAAQGVTVDKVTFEKDLALTAEEADPAALLAWHKWIFNVAKAIGTARSEIGVYRKKANDTWDYSSGVSITDTVVAPATEAIEKAASIWAKEQGAFHIEIVEVNQYLPSCRVLVYRTGTPIVPEKYIIYRENDVTKAKAIA